MKHAIVALMLFGITYFPGAAAGQIVELTSRPKGYSNQSIELPRPFAGALAADPDDDDIVYASVGFFSDNDLARIHLSAKTVEIIADDAQLGNIGGIAPLADGKIAIVENSSSQTILLLSDNDADGDFLDAGEIGELIAPILDDGPFGFSGAHARRAPAGDPSGIPSGSLLVQTADGMNESSEGIAELLVVENPLTAPAYRPAAGAFFSGFVFNGGFAFDSQGRVFLGNATLSGGEMFALVNANGDEDIDAGESHLILTGEAGMSGVEIDAEDDVFYATQAGVFTGPTFIRTFPVPADPLTATAAPAPFLGTNADFIYFALNSQTKSFEPFSGPNGATMVLSGSIGFGGANNIIALTPAGPPPSAAAGWRDYQ